jgi:hypothetical protein
MTPAHSKFGPTVDKDDRRPLGGAAREIKSGVTFAAERVFSYFEKGHLGTILVVDMNGWSSTQAETAPYGAPAEKPSEPASSTGQVTDCSAGGTEAGGLPLMETLGADVE